MRRTLHSLLFTTLPGTALAHASDQGFVLLLPTDIFITAGVAVVALTVAALFLLPDRLILRLFTHRPLAERPQTPLATMTSLAAFLALAALVALGLAGPRDPLSNLMPLMFWTVGWVGLVSLSGVFGNLWTWLNPWTGLYRLIGPTWRQRPLPESWGLWPAILLLVAFTAFLLADIAPDDPARLATLVAVYWTLTMAGLLIAGPSWLKQVELGHAICGTYAKLAAVSKRPPAGVGGPGWQLLASQPVAMGLFALTLLAAGSFDGLNETFWWFGLIGVNPLEFPGRSAVIGETIAGLGVSLALLYAAFALTVWLGLKVSGRNTAFRRAFERLALSLLPIALVYHIAHYLPSVLVTIQYTYAALSDPLNTGADLLGIEPFRVTTGFFNRLDTVRLIWLTQAGLVVLGHVWSVLLAHRIGLDIFGHGRRAAWGTLPLSLFMIGYTFLGLWLLAAPRGA
ncbi:MAG: hypothetical protein QNJ20_11445 [Paracoccaceae bacterium]|nr:hypothetical protein [Paracoccaceae bacterium]